EGCRAGDLGAELPHARLTNLRIRASNVADASVRASGLRDALAHLHELEELAQANLLVASQVWRYGEHSFDHLARLFPIAAHARSHELFACSRSRTVRGNDIGDQGSKLIDDLHETPQAIVYDHAETVGLR